MKATLSIALLLAATQAWCQAPAPQGEIKGQAIVHTPESARAAMANGALVLPSAATGGAVFTGAFKDAPRETRARVPVVVFLHGSSGLGLKAIGEWQQWLATMGIASFAPDSFALPGRVTYTSPVGKDFYEKIHALRGSEITLAVQALKDAPWADPRRMVLAGTSEGATAVARYAGDAFAARMIFSWSCEDNYFVETHRTAVRPEQPVLNVISATDPFFSRSNAWLGQPAAVGHCAAAFKDHPKASIVLIPGAPHTLLNLPAARQVVAGYLQDALK
ncbi:MAG TPA: dienelactone hydrolase family protein [Burkholderiaceae bacterium]|jgi:dienelactone hydrolase|nr:alpha/beta hydrolase [Comamonadaceae bacterium]HOF31598.1 dienelactone hydrolase family protein [Burkholderiaceae bacterium]HPL78914.1 dienelactone hydrolase family protein [Burkholderiaceae bacterium]